MAEYLEPSELAPDDYQKQLHLGRYIWASQHIKNKMIANASCSTNYGWDLLKKSTNSVIGFDRNQEALKKAKEKGRNWFIEMDFQDETFDGFTCLVCLETLEHMEDPWRFVQRLAPTITEAVFSVPIIPTKETNKWHLHDFTEEEFKEKLKSLGWKIEHEAYQEANDQKVYLLVYVTR